MLRVLRFLRVWRVLGCKSGRKKPVLIDVWRGVAVGCRMKHAKSTFEGASKRQTWRPRKAIDVWPWQQDRFDRGKRRRRSSTPAVVPGAAPALAKAGVGGYIYIYIYLTYHEYHHEM